MGRDRTAPGRLSAVDIRLALVNLYLRLAVKPVLRRLADPGRMRTMLERDAARRFVVPEDAHFVEDLMRRDGPPRQAGMIPAIWASVGRPDRRKVILYLHGGAYLAGSPRTHRHLAAALAGEAGVRAVVPDYRLAPETPFPAAIDDALAAYCHLLTAGYEATEIAVAGDSAGGGLSFALVLALADRDLPLPACVVGFSPWTDMTGTAESLRRNAARDVLLPANRMDDVVAYYLGVQDRAHRLASPALASWPEPPPPTLIMASRSEILRDDAVHMADTLRKAGGDVQLELWRGLPHAWPIFYGRIRQADMAIETAGAFIGRHLGAEPEG
ncbi:MAG: alpha/beta hydrolase [Pseudomonadota bacterium]